MKTLVTRCLLIFAVCLAVGGSARATAPTPRAASQTLEFIENKGQWDARGHYAAALLSGRLFAEADGLRFALVEAVQAPGYHRAGRPGTLPPADSRLQGHALKIRFAGSRPVRPTATGPTAEHRNYFLGADPAHWASDVRSYRQLHYAGLWPSVDARVYENEQQQLEYDFELAAGADPRAIALRHEGAEALTLDDAGNLRVKTAVGQLTELAPQAWQTSASGQRQPVACRYVLAGGEVRFALGRYDHSRPLTIDPVVVFSTYTGSSSDNWGFTATYDAQGNLYSGGVEFGFGFPTSLGAFRTTFGGVMDMAFIKYNVNLNGTNSRVWATYLGGNQADFPHSLVVNSLGELLVLGTTASTNFPTTVGALQRTFGGGSIADPFGFGGGFNGQVDFDLINGSDLVITRLNANGSVLVGSTYLGGSGNDGLLPLDPYQSATSATPQLAHNYGDAFRGDILVDAADNVYIASSTSSLNFPLARGFSSTYRGGTSDGIVCKLAPDLTALTWGSYLGGSGSDAAYSLQLDPQGDVYVAGGTLSPNFPTTPGSLQPTRPGNVDGFAARIVASGTALLRATYLGTASYDQTFFLQIGRDGGVYVLGQTLGPYPTTPGLYRNANGRQFIQKLNPDLSTTLLATVFGSGRATVDIDPTAFLVDQCDRVYICGWGGNENQIRDPNNILAILPYLTTNGFTDGLPITADAVQPVTDGSDFYLAQFAAGLTGLEYATFYGAPDPPTGQSGDHVDGGTSRFDPRGIIYQAVCACPAPTGFPIPPGANSFSTTNNSGNCNNAAFVFNFQPSIANAGGDQAVCATAGPVALVGSPGGGVWAGPGVTGTAATGYVFTPSLALLGVQVLTYTAGTTGICVLTATRRVTVTNPPTATFTPLLQTSYCLPSTGAPALPVVGLTATPVGGTFSGPGVTGTVATGFSFNPNLAGIGSHTLTYSYNSGCPATASRVVQVLGADAGAGQAVCSLAGPVPLLMGTPAGGTWAGPGVTGSLTTGFVFTPSASLAGSNTLTYTVNNPDCNATSSRVITVSTPPVFVFPPALQPVYCLPPAGAPALPVVALNATLFSGIFRGPGVTGTDSTLFTFNPALAGLGLHTLTYIGRGSCPASATQTVRVLGADAGPGLTLCSTAGPVPLAGAPTGGTWRGPGVTGSTTAGFVFTPSVALAGANSLTYTVTAADATCSSTKTVTVLAVPTIVLTPVPALCVSPAPYPLLATPLGGTWSGPGVSGNAGSGYFFTPTTPGTFQLLYTAGNTACPTQSTLTATVYPSISLQLPADTVLCPGSSQAFRLRSNPAGGTWSGPGVSGSPVGGYTFTSPPGFTGPASLVYTVANPGCSATATRRVSAAPAPVLAPAGVPTTCPESRLAPLTMRFTPGMDISAGLNVVWDFGDGTQSTEPTPTHTYAAGRFQPTLRVRFNSNRCETQATLPAFEVVKQVIPNIITPNGDGANDFFSLGPDCSPHLQVFSRWGQRVFEAAAYRNDWNAAGQSAGIYYYLLEYGDGHRVRGWLEVVK